MTAKELICEQIRTKGKISFAEFMQHALYAPNLGYYSSARDKFGATGDFVTAPELTPLFGQAIANQCAELLPLLDKPVLFEFGAGSGALCVAIMAHLESMNKLPDTYHILDVSAHLRMQQLETFKQHIPHLLDKISWHTAWPEKPFQGIMIANEVLDAMPVHRFLQTQSDFLESYIVLDNTHELKEIFEHCENAHLCKTVQASLPKELYPYQSEVNLMIDGWISQCFTLLEKGMLLIIDYGFPAHEYYHPDRHMGTLMCHHRHTTHPNPLSHIGEQDITAHVNFTHVAEAGYQAGFHVAGYTNQASFLLSNGLLNLLATNKSDETSRLQTQQAVKQLLQPSEMGELFKVMALTKDLHVALTGFQLSDKRASL